MSPIEDLKTRLRCLREFHGLTQQQVADHTGLDYKFYQYVESPRKKQIWLETVAKISVAYHLELWEFFHPDYLSFSKPPQIKAKR